MNGGPGDDWLDGRRGAGNVSIGERGDDFIQAEGKIDGGPGNDEIESFGYLNPSQSPFGDRTDAGGGRDKVRGGSSSELLKGGRKKDKIWAGDGDDRLLGNGGNDRLYGENGYDSINGGSGNDVCDQGSGTGTLRQCP